MLKPKRAALKVQPTGLQSASPGLAPLSPYRHGARPNRGRSGLPLVTLRQANHTFLALSQFKYKSATETVAAWLEKTAKACGYSMDPRQTDASSTTTTNNDKTSQPPSEGFEGNARELTEDHDDNTSATERYKVTINQFVSLADFIAAASSPPPVPRLITRALDRAIRIRREHGQHLRQSRPQDAELLFAFQQHGYFISVLEHVREVLCPSMSEGQLKNKPKGLNVRDGTTATLEKNHKAELRQDAEEAYLGFDLLTQDFRSLRTVIRRTWVGYQLGIFDLVTVSLVTNSAIGIARRMQEGVQKLFDKHGGSSQMLNAFYVASCKVYGDDPDFREQPDDDMNFHTYDLAGSMMVPTFMVMQTFDALVEPANVFPFEPAKIPPYELAITTPSEPGSYGTPDQASDRSKKSAREKFQEDKTVLVRILWEFLTFHEGVSPQPFEDELTKGIRLMLDTHEIPIWLVFAVQVFLDIHHALQGGLKKGLADLIVSARPIEAFIKENLEFYSSPTIAEWPKCSDRAFLATLQILHRRVDSDPVEELNSRPQMRPAEMFRFMKWNPLFCGMLSYNIQCRYQELILEGQAESGSIIHSAHLHNVVCNEEPIRPRSVDMDLAMSRHDEIFVGEAPCKPENHLQQ